MDVDEKDAVSNENGSGNHVDDEDDNANDSGTEEGVKRWQINPEPTGRRKIIAKRRADTAAFEQWIEQHQDSLSKRSRKMAPGDEQSAVALVRNFENKKIIESPRDYQIELFELSKTQNTIAILDTGKIAWN